MLRNIKIKVTLLGLMFSYQVFSCTSPTGVAGQLSWVPAQLKVLWCDGTNWIDPTVSTTSSCSGVTAGTIRYFSGATHFCNGTNWISMKGNLINSCSGVTAGTIRWDSALTAMKMCDGANWYKLKLEP